MVFRRTVFHAPAGRAGVSEVVGSVLLLVITVAAFAVLFLMVQGVPKPAPGVSSNFEASLEYTGPTSADVELSHIGGASIENGSGGVVVTVGNITTTYSISEGMGDPDAVFSVGSTWRISLATPVNNSTFVSVGVFSFVSNELLFQTTLQEGAHGGEGGHRPIITVAWAASSAGTARVYNNNLQSYRIHAVVVDPDGDLNGTGAVTAKLTVVPDGALLSTTSIGSGSYTLVRTQGGHFQSADLVMAPGVLPGNYQVEVQAKDATDLTATALVPLEVINGNVAGGPTVTVVSTSTAPVAVETNDQNVSVLKLDVSTVGETASISQVIVGKQGLLPDGQVTVAIWLDADDSGTFSAATDLQLTPKTAFTAGAASIFSVPIMGVTEADPITVFVVANFNGATDGSNVTFSIADGADIRGTGVPSGATSSTNGSFPLVSTEVIIGSRLRVEPSAGVPDRVLKDSQGVRVLALSVQAAGEDMALGQVNITLLGTIPRSSVQASVRVGGQIASTTVSFNAARIATVPLNYTLTEVAGWVEFAVYMNLTGGENFTVGMQLPAGPDFFATGSQSGIGRSGVSNAGFPMSSGTVAITATGNLSVDPFIDAALENDFRAGLTNAYVMTLLLHAHGENVDFNKLEVSKNGTLADGDFTALTMRVRGGPWFSGTFFSGRVTWDAGVTGKLFAITIGPTNTGEAIVDIYANLSTGTQGKQTAFEIGSSAKVRGYAKSTLTTVNAGAEAEPYALSSGTKFVKGSVYVTGFNLAPGWIFAPKNGVPILKLTLRALGENVTLDELFYASMLGVPPAGSVTVRLYRDVNNDTTTTVGADDVQLVPAQAGAFGSDALKAFTPGLTVTTFADVNIYFALDVTASAAGFSVQTSVDTSQMAFRGASSTKNITPNIVIGGPNPLATASQSPAIPVVDRGGLTVAGVPLNPENHTHQGSIQFFLRVALTASAIEGVSVSTLKFHLKGNITPSQVRIDLWWDKDKNNATDESDFDYGDQNFTGEDMTFALSPPVTIAAGGTEWMIVKVTVQASTPVGKTVGVEVGGASKVTATGSTSGLQITPTGSFPATSFTVPVFA